MLSRGFPVLVVLLGAALYVNVLDAPFVFDDVASIVENDRLAAGPLEALVAPEQSPLAGRPVVTLTLALNRRFGGLDPRGYRGVNVAIHVLATFVLWVLVRGTLRLPRVGAPRCADAVAAAAALLWLVHPLQTELVGYVTQRTESLAALCYLTMLWLVLRSASSPRPRILRLAAILVCATGMLTKESMVTAPVAALLFDAVFLAAGPRDALRRRGGLHAGLAATWLVLAAVMLPGPRSDTVGFGLGTSPWDWLANQCWVLPRYLGLAFWPAGLAFDYGVPRAIGVDDVLPGAVLLVGLLGASLWALVRRPALGFLGCWCFLILAPTSSVVPIVSEVGAERRFYLPLAALAVLVVLAARAALHRVAPSARVARIAAATVLAVVVIALSVATVRRNRDYASAERIWRTAAEALPDNYRAHYNLGEALARNGRREAALDHYATAVRLEPTDTDVLNNYGVLLAELGRVDEARELLERAVALRSFADAHYNLGKVLELRDDLPGALAQFALARERRPDWSAPYDAAAWLLATARDPALRRPEAALRLATQAAELGAEREPGLLDTLAAAYAATGRFDAAIETATEAIARLEAAGRVEQAARVRARLVAYRLGRPWVE